MFLVLLLTSCNHSTTDTTVKDPIDQPQVQEKIQFDASVAESVKMIYALTSDSPNVPIEIPNYTFTASLANIESGLTVRFTIVNADVSSHQEWTAGSKENIFSRSQSRIRPASIKIMVYKDGERDNFTEKEFVFNGSVWVEKN